MVQLVERTIRVDKQGRLVLPSNVRKQLGLRRNGGTVSVRLDGARIVLEPVYEDLERRVAEWRKSVLALHAKPFTEQIEESWKWISVDYARRKLGVH
jgi:AbrB family looped-hinge helix DNA binding protein